MIKKILSALTIGFFCLSTSAQSISPVETLEFCPLQDITFTVTLPLIQNNTLPSIASWTNGPIVVSGISSVSNSQTQTACTFVGRFRDVNITQVYKIDFIPSGGSAATAYFSFKKIKSLFYPNPIGSSGSSPCQQFRANQSSFTAQICQVVSQTISVNNTNWSTYGEGNDFCWGSITNFEYQLPNQWSIGNSVSSGNNWIAGGNSVSVTSDLTNGVNGVIRVRPRNTCGSGLSNNVSQAIIPILRPDPPLSISGPTQLCFPNSYTYTLSGVPSGAVVSWPTNSYYTLSQSGNTATISPTSAANGGANVTASVYLPSCGLTFTKSFYISIGVPTVTFNIVSYPDQEPNCYEVSGIYSFQAQQATGYPNTYSGFDWGWRNLTNSTVSSDPTVYGSQYSFFPYDAGTYEIWVKPTNSCGSGTTESIKTVTVVEICSGGFRMQSSNLTVYPNPTKGQIKVQIPVEYRKNSILQVSNQFGILLSRKVPTGSQIMDIDISKFGNGIYQLTLKSGNTILQTKLIKQ